MSTQKTTEIILKNDLGEQLWLKVTLDHKSTGSTLQLENSMKDAEGNDIEGIEDTFNFIPLIQQWVDSVNEAMGND